MDRNADTIAAIATPPGSGGLGVIRISGPQAEGVALQMLGYVPKPREASYSSFRNKDGDTVDRGLALYFKGPRSYTGEDTLELHAHGGWALLQLLLGSSLEAGARLAEPGEFTQRAFLNNKLDLAQAEAVADVIEAASKAAVFSAQRSLSGDFSKLVNTVKDELVAIRVSLEAAIDFSDEEIDLLEDTKIQSRIARLADKLADIKNSAAQGKLLREGISVAIIGKTNVGKSSLMNQLVGEEASIVTPYAGTTRDVIRREFIIKGVPIRFVDTAGIRETTDPIEKIGIELTTEAARESDVVIRVGEANQTQTSDTIEPANDASKVITVRNKIDLLGESASISDERGEKEIRLSAKTGDGIELLKTELLRICGANTDGETPFMGRARHISAIEKAFEYVIGAQANKDRIELCADDLRLAHDAVSEITGEFLADDLLGEIFSSFCIGK